MTIKPNKSARWKMEDGIYKYNIMEKQLYSLFQLFVIQLYFTRYTVICYIYMSGDKKKKQKGRTRNKSSRKN